MDSVESLRRELRVLAVAIGAPIATRRTRKDRERWSAELNRLADRLAALAPAGVGNTPIAELVARYSEECCDFTNAEWVRAVALRLVDAMPDSQARCILHTLTARPDSVSEAEVEAFAASFYPRGDTYEPERIRAALEAARAKGGGG